VKINTHLKLGQQLALVFGFIILLTTILAGVGWNQIKGIQDHFDGVVERTLPTLSALSDVQERLLQMRVAELQHLAALTMPEKDREEIKVKEAAAVFDVAVKKYVDVSSGLDNAALVAQLKTNVKIFQEDRIPFLQMSYSAAGAEIERAEEARDYFNGPGLQAFLGAYNTVQQLRAHHTRQADAAKARGGKAASSAIQLLLGIGAVIIALSVLLASFITWRVTHQLGGEPSHVAHIAQRIAEGDLYVPIPLKPHGDRSLMGVMGTMQTALREMMRKLQEAQAEIVASARQAGMAEIATNVLHNVGNVLNTVNVAADMMNTQLRTSRLNGLARAVQMLDAHADDLGAFLTQDPKGRLLPAYLRELSHTLEAEHEGLREELGVLGKSIDHINKIVASQQSYAGTRCIVERLTLREVVEDALRMQSDMRMLQKVAVVKNVAELPALMLDRHRLLQILVNLISNARHAVDRLTEVSPCIRLDALLINEHVLRITVADNGEGIASENLVRIFTHGFTTRSKGNGFGLHSSVLAAREMGGSLTAYSDGPGKGAVFTLELPIGTPEEA
jgi:signal transduction histidine kinase